MKGSSMATYTLPGLLPKLNAGLRSGQDSCTDLGGPYTTNEAGAPGAHRPSKVPVQHIAVLPPSMRNLRMMHLLDRIASSFNHAGVPLMALKGAALNLTLYNRPNERPMGDLDLMVRLEDIDRALALLEESGGLRSEPLVREHFFPKFHYEIDYTFGTIYPVTVDLHVRPFRPLRYSRLVPPTALWGAAESVTIGRGNILVPSVEDMLVHLTVHAAVHGCTGGKWLEDIRGWIGAHEGRIDWDRFLATVEQWRMALPVRKALVRVEHESGEVCPLEVSRRLSQMRVNWRDRLALGQAPRDARHPTAHVAVNALSTPGWRFRLGYLRAQILPDKAHMADWYCWRHWGWLPCAHVFRWLRPIVSRIPGGRLWLSKAEVQPSAIHGVGLFATQDIRCGEAVAHFYGKKVDRDGTYVAWHRDPSGRKQRYELTGKLRFLNHSCCPNAHLSRFAVLALKPIRAGEEITIEYEGATCTCREEHREQTSGSAKTRAPVA